MISEEQLAEWERCCWRSHIGYACELADGHDGNHVATDLDGKSKVGWASNHRSAYCVGTNTDAVPALIAEVRRLRGGAAAYATVCSAIGIEYAPDTGPTYPGPVEAVVAAIKEVTRERDTLMDVVASVRDGLDKIADGACDPPMTSYGTGCSGRCKYIAEAAIAKLDEVKP